MCTRTKYERSKFLVIITSDVRNGRNKRVRNGEREEERERGREGGRERGREGERERESEEPGREGDGVAY